MGTNSQVLLSVCVNAVVVQRIADDGVANIIRYVYIRW